MPVHLTCLSQSSPDARGGVRQGWLADIAGLCKKGWESAEEQRIRLPQAQSTCSSRCYHSGVFTYLNSCPPAMKEAADRKDCRYPRTSAKWEQFHGEEVDASA